MMQGHEGTERLSAEVHSDVRYRQFNNDDPLQQNDPLHPVDTSMGPPVEMDEETGPPHLLGRHVLSGGDGVRSPWGWGSNRSPLSPVSNSSGYGLHIQNPDRLLESTPRWNRKSDMQRSQTEMPSRLPQWMWNLVLLGLGIGNRTDKKRFVLATLLHITTLLFGLLFGASGFFFNVYDTMSNYTKTTVITAVTKSVIGLMWICMGVYANSLAARLFGNPRMADCIRLHSKTFMKVSTVLVVSVLCVTVLATNIYTDIYLLEVHHDSNVSEVTSPNCATFGVSDVLCKSYFISKIVYSVLCMTWNLLVVAIFLSVCRTHTIGIRRFMKELMCDTKIYEEFCVLQALECRDRGDTVEERGDFLESWTVWDDDITCSAWDDPVTPLPQNAQVLRTLRDLRQNSDPGDRNMSFRDRFMRTYSQNASFQPQETANIKSSSTNRQPSETEHLADVQEDDVFPPSQGSDGTPRNHDHREPYEATATGTAADTLIRNRKPSFRRRRSTNGRLDTMDMRPPIMKNDDLMFTYFMLVRRLCATSRVLQRWLSSWIAFTMLWCGLLIVFWMDHTAQLLGIVQFMLPLVVLGLLTSAYAEVNFDGERLLKCIFPTEERMPVIFYFHNTRLELKIFSFTMTYNAILTVVAGIAVTFATRIILDQFELL